MFTDVFRVEYSKNPPLDQSSSFLGCHFSNITFSDLCLCERTVYECIFREVTFQNCQFISTIFSECHFNLCQFKNCKIVSSSIEECSFSFSSAQQCDSTNNRIFNSFFCDCSFFSSNSEYDTLCSSSFSEGNTADDCALTYSIIRDCFGLLPTCPEKGSFIGFKQLQHDIIVELKIPTDARRISGFSRKCRADKAIVLGFYNKKGEPLSNLTHEHSRYDGNFVYTRGQVVHADDFDPERTTCAPGIHFFLTFQEAVDYIQ